MNKNIKRPSTNIDETISISEYGESLASPLQQSPIVDIAKQINMQTLMRLIAGARSEGISEDIHRYMQSIGMKRGADFYNMDVSEVKKYTYNLGNPMTRMERYNWEDTSVIVMLRLGMILSIKGDAENPIINGFKKSKSKQWKDSTKGKIKIKDHCDNEPLVCPVCNTEYHNTKDILLAQTVSHHEVIVKVSELDKDEIRLYRPHVVLTPVCPNCYCDKASSNMQHKFDGINVSPMFNVQDHDRHLVPLLPKCLSNRLDGEENANMSTNPMLFWPASSRSIICSNTIKLIRTTTES